MQTPPVHSFTTSFFGTWKLFRRYISERRFIHVSFVVAEFSNFKYLRSSRKYYFWLLLGGLHEMWSNLIETLTTDAMRSNTSFFWQSLFNSKEMVKIGPKNWFTLFYTLSFMPQSSAKLKLLWRYIIVVSFISIAFVVAKLWIFKCFRSSKKYHCRLLLGSLSQITPSPPCPAFL